MKRLAATRFGFFLFAAIVSAVMALVIEPAFRWVPIALSALYVALSIVFLLDEAGQARGGDTPP
jgi:predicted membrane channel-forming protein YqfA (hemolysin III family)